MYKILVIDNGPMDLQITEDILRRGLKNATAFCVENLEEGILVLESEAVNLVIIDVDQSTLLIRDFLRLGRMYRPNLSVLLTSVIREEELLPIGIRLAANACLLKPFSPQQLLAAIAPLLLLAAEEEEKEGLTEQQAYLSRLRAACQEFSYQQAAVVVKEYLDFLYQHTENITLVRERIVDFAAELATLRTDMDPDLLRIFNGNMERLRSRFDLQGNKYQARMLLESMLGVIFISMERESFYDDDIQKKALNYINRNVKKGIKLDDVANYVNMSASYFSKFFKKACGVNFIDYVVERKLDYAKDMLIDTDMPVGTIAYELSFHETNYFSKTFKKRVGCTPSQYREQHLSSKIK